MKKIMIENFRGKFIKDIWLLRNKNFSKNYFLNEKKDSLENHMKWIKRYVKKKDKIFLISRIKSKLIGYIRIDYRKSVGEVSLIVDKSYRKNKIATKLLKKALKQKRSSTIIAKVHIDNKISLKFFIKNNFVIFKTHKKIVYLRYVMKKKNYKNIIKKIENVRKKNNKNWMDILRLAFENSPNEASKIFLEIYKEDKQISKLAKQLTK